MRLLYPFLTLLLILSPAAARADESADIVNGIFAEAKLRDGNALNVGQQGRAALFASTVASLARLGVSIRETPIVFTTATDPATGVASLQGTGTSTYLMGAVCTSVTVTVKAHMPVGDTTYLNIYVESVELKVAQSRMCV